MGLNENATRAKEVYLKTKSKNETTRPWMFKKIELAVYLG